MAHDDTDTTPFGTPIRSQADLERTWRRLMGRLGFSEHLLWLMLVDAHDEPTRQMVQVEIPDAPPPPEEADGMAALLGQLLDELSPGGRWAVLRSRPGRGGAGPDDLAWGRALTTACRRAGVPLDVLHLATDTDLVPLPYDALAVA